MSLQVLREGYHSIMKGIYAPKPYYQRVRTFMREYRPPALRAHIGGEYLLAFVRSVVVLGIIGRERVQYWRLLAWTLVRKPRMLSLAVTLAIYGHNFRKFCRQHMS